MALDNDRLNKPIQRLRKFFKKAPKRPTVDQIHRLRTSSRRFEAELEALGLSSGRNERRVLPDVQKIRKRAGKIRDLDVLTGHLLKLDVDGEQDCIVELVEAFGVKRAKQAKKLRKLVLRNRSQLRRRLKQSSRMLDELLSKVEDADSGSQPATEVAANALRLAGDLKTPARLTKSNLHPYRLKVKALQYVLQLSDEAEQQEFIDKLRAVKDAIGEWHDWEELIAIAKESLDHGAECKLLPKLKTLSEEKYERALSLTNHMRNEFISPRTSDTSRKPRRSRAIHTRAINVAASAIAR